MISKILNVILFLTLNFCAIGQNIKDNTGRQNLFTDGIYLEDLNVMIPWYATFEDIQKYGSPKIDTASGRTLDIRWDSTRILSDININLRYSAYKIFLGNGKYSKLTTIYGTIDARDFEKIKNYLENYSGTRGILYEGKSRNAYSWVIDGCNIRLGYWKGRWQQYGSFLDIQKK